MISNCKALIICKQELKDCQELTNEEYCKKHHKQYNNKDDCSVCMENVNMNTECPLECGHWFHKQCIVQTNLHICPLCRTRMTDEETSYIFGENHIEQNIYNDGTSIYFNHEEFDENAYQEFGHGEDVNFEDDEEDYLQSYSEETKIALLNYHDNMNYEEQIETINNIDVNVINEITIHIRSMGSLSDIFYNDTIFSYIHENDLDQAVLWIVSVVMVTVSDRMKEENNNEEPDEETMKNIVKIIMNRIVSEKQYSTMLRILHNVTKSLLSTQYSINFVIIIAIIQKNLNTLYAEAKEELN